MRRFHKLRLRIAPPSITDVHSRTRRRIPRSTQHADRYPIIGKPAGIITGARLHNRPWSLCGEIYLPVLLIVAVMVGRVAETVLIPQFFYLASMLSMDLVFGDFKEPASGFHQRGRINRSIVEDELAAANLLDTSRNAIIVEPAETFESLSTISASLPCRTLVLLSIAGSYGKAIARTAGYNAPHVRRISSGL